MVSSCLLASIHLLSGSGSDDKLAVCRRNGADVTVNYKTTDFAEEVLSATNKKGNFPSLQGMIVGVVSC